ncbi:MAG: ComF family protein [Fusobacteriaceae bacterium]|nr:ComF family protein [Fusobacteriaceae bacterium]
MKFLIQKFKKLLFSDNCSICLKLLKNDETYLCKKCLDYLKENNQIKNKGNFYYIYYYNEKIRRLIGDYKLKNRKGLDAILSSIIKDELQKILLEKEIDTVIPVPISKKRELERGFNQVEEILKCCDIHYSKIDRVKDTKHMYELKSSSERDKNVKDAFKIEFDLTDKNILIVDDILTTGATVKEIAREIRKLYKVKGIYVFSIAVANRFLMNEFNS